MDLRLAAVVILTVLVVATAPATPQDVGAAPETIAVQHFDTDSRPLPAPEPLHHPRINPMLARLPDGKILAFGGYTGNTGGVAESEIYDPAQGRWTDAGALTFTRYCSIFVQDYHGRVIVVGGRPFPNGSSSASVEIFDPKTRRWSDGPAMKTARDAIGLTLLAGGKLLAVGGYVAVDGRGNAIDEVELYDPINGNWTPAARRPEAAWWPYTHRLPDGRVLSAGGSNNGAGNAAYIYDPKQDSWRAVQPLLHAHEDGRSVDLGGGRILIAGGYHSGSNPYIGEAEIYDPKSQSWKSAGYLSIPRQASALVGIKGRAALIGGTNRNGTLATVEIYDSTRNTWHLGPRLRTPRSSAEAIAIDERHVLIVGGSDGARPLDSVEILDLDGPADTSEIAAQQPSYVPPITYAPPPQQRQQRETYAPPTKAPAVRFAAKAAERPQDYAVVVGVGRYERLPPADFAEDDARDAAAMMTALGVPEENIVTLAGPRATMTEVVKYVEEWLPSRVGADSRVYFYYSGHGAPNVADGVPYLMPWDADASFVKSTGLPLERVYAALGKLPAKEVIAMIDACFSGAGGRSVLAPGTRPLVPVRAPSRVPPNISILTASGSDEIAGSAPERRHGLFTYYMLRGLEGEADAAGTGHVSLKQLHAYVRKHVILDARAQDREQTPTLTSPNPGLKLY